MNYLIPASSFNISQTDVSCINLYISNGNVNEVIYYMENKDISNIDELLGDDKLTDIVYDYVYDVVSGSEQYKSREEFLNQFLDYEKLVVKMKDFNHCIRTDGFREYRERDIAEDIDTIIEFIDFSQLECKNELLNLLYTYKDICEAIEELDKNSSFYEIDLDNRKDALKSISGDYELYSEDLMIYFEHYIRSYAPPKYIEHIKDRINVSI